MKILLSNNFLRKGGIFFFLAKLHAFMYGSKLYFMCSVGVAFTLFTVSRIASTNEDAIYFFYFYFFRILH